MCTCLLCVCTNDIDVQVCVIVRNRNSVRGRALRSKGGSNEIDTSALDSPLPVPLLFFPLSFITCPFSFSPLSPILFIYPLTIMSHKKTRIGKKKIDTKCVIIPSKSLFPPLSLFVVSRLSLSLLLFPPSLEFPSPVSLRWQP